MGSDNIYKEARRLVRWAGTRDPFRIAKELGVHVIFDCNFNALIRNVQDHTAQPFYHY